MCGNLEAKVDKPLAPLKEDVEVICMLLGLPKNLILGLNKQPMIGNGYVPLTRFDMISYINVTNML